MNNEMIELIRKQAQGRPYELIRVIGNRAEVHYLGDYQMTVLEIQTESGRETPAKVEQKTLDQMRLDELRKMAFELEIPTRGKRKAELIAEIRQVKNGLPA